MWHHSTYSICLRSHVVRLLIRIWSCVSSVSLRFMPKAHCPRLLRGTRKLLANRYARMGDRLLLGPMAVWGHPQECFWLPF
ncbi:hypothetical protein D3C71_1747910 [compost metagenome]